MTDDLLSLRALVASPDAGLRDLFRQAPSTLPLPIEIVEAADADDACRTAATPTDIAYLDGAFPPQELGRIASALRAAAKPAFTMQLASDAAMRPFETDGLAGKPSRPEEVKWLLERSMRLLLQSRVLIVDDSSTMRSIVRKTLAATRFPFDVSEAPEGLAALKRVREEDFQIVFLDYNMPGFNGLETLAEFKREDRGITVILMTSAPHQDLVDKARALGAAFLKKPFFPADIEAVLSSYYGLRAVNPKRV